MKGTPFWLLERYLLDWEPSLDHLVGMAGGLAACLLLMSILPWVILSQRKGLVGSRWQAYLDQLDFPSPGKRLMNWLSALDQQLRDALSKGKASWIEETWDLAWMGSGPLSLFAAVLACVGMGILSWRLGLTPILAGFLVLILITGLGVLSWSRAQKQRQLFQAQLPQVLERLADGLQSGLSLVQALEFLIPNLPSPSSGELSRVLEQIELGFSTSLAFRELGIRQDSQDVRFLVDGVDLAQKTGGDLPGLMRSLAEMAYQRAALKKEIQTMTAQGRLSALVIALLIPVSLVLLAFFPGYIDILFQSSEGNLVLVLAGLLEGLGAVLVLQLIKVKN